MRRARRPRPWPSLKQSTAQDAIDRPQVRVTHPFHPDRGRSFPLVAAKQLWGEARVTVEHPDGTLHSIPVGWTDLAPIDPYVVIGRARSRFRVEDLVALADLMAVTARRSR